MERLTRGVIAGRAFPDLPFEDEERVPEVESVLLPSYDDLKPRAQYRFRTLGAFAPDASFSAEFAAALWECSTDEAHAQLTAFYDGGLLDLSSEQAKEKADSPLLQGEGTGVRWQQHLLLRDYALALLRQAGEEETTRRKHAEIFAQAMREAEDKQKYSVMLPEYAQLRHAFEWAIESDFGMAQGLISKTANLQRQFGFVRDSNVWSIKFLELAQKGSDTGRLADALVIRGIILRDLASLPGEDRAARLRDALAAYDEALRFWTPDTAPLAYAMTQFNLAILAMDLAELPGEDKHARWKDAIRYAVTAGTIFAQQQHAPYAQQAANLLRWIAETCGETFPELWKEVEDGQ